MPCGNEDSCCHRPKLLSSDSLNQIGSETVYWYANYVQLTCRQWMKHPGSVSVAQWINHRKGYY